MSETMQLKELEKQADRMFFLLEKSTRRVSVLAKALQEKLDRNIVLVGGKDNTDEFPRETA